MTENKKGRTQTNKKKKKKSKTLKIISITILSIVLFVAAVTAGMALAIIKTAPELDVTQITAAKQPSVILDDKGDPIDTLITDKKRVIIQYTDMPKNLINAFVSIEDERFFEHNGIDPKRIIGAIFFDVKNVLTGKKSLQGASTITQQLLKNTLFDTNTQNLDSESVLKRKITRKIQEWYLAPKLEELLDKNSIIAAYLNTIYLGGRAIGVEAASQQYFNVPAKNLSLVQCAFMAGLTKSPSVLYPYSNTSKKDPSKYKDRTKVVLAKMLENGHITESEYKNAVAEIDIPKDEITNDKNTATLGKSTIGKATAIKDKYNFEWFSRPVVSEVKKDLKEKYHYTNDEIDNLLVNGNLKIYSTMDKKLQLSTQKIIDDDDNLRVSSREDKDGLVQPQMSAVLVDYHTGEVKVMIGGRGEQPALSYNRAWSAKLPAGSSIKPLTVYAPAIDTKIATAATVIEDSPISSSMGRKYNAGRSWDPKNAPNSYSGYITLREGLKHSKNLYAIKLEDKLGLSIGATYGDKFGISLDEVDRNSIAALALGESHKGCTNTFIMANAYGVFGNNGRYTTPKLYTKVVDEAGKVLLQPETNTKKVLSPEAAYIMYDLLKGPVRSGTATRAKLSYSSDIPLAGKTGSTTNFKNLWFCGLTPYYSGAVWIGNKNDQSIYSSDAAYIFGKIMNKAVENLAVKEVSAPSGVTSASVDAVSGLLPTELSYLDPRGTVYTELFISGTVPTEYDNIHVSAEINKLNGKLATSTTPQELIQSSVFIKRDYTPSVYLQDQQYVLPKEFDNSVGSILPKIEDVVPNEDANDKNTQDDTKKQDDTTLDDDENQDTEDNNDENNNDENTNGNDKPTNNNKNDKNKPKQNKSNI